MMKTKRIFLLGWVGMVSIGLAALAMVGAARASSKASSLTSNGTAPVYQVQPAGGFSPVEVLLVDDDNNGPDSLAYYAQLLTTLGYSFNIWNTGNSDAEPDLATLQQYQAVIWFTGNAGGSPLTGPGPQSEIALGTYLDQGGCFFISSQDYSTDRGLTQFMMDYLGTDETVIDLGDFIALSGEGSTYANLGPFSLSYPFPERADIISPTLGVEVAFRGFLPNTYPAGVYKDGGVYKTTFLGFPLEATSLFDGNQILSRFLVDCFPDDVMLVDDDDNDPDVLLYYTQILDQLGYHYTIWDTDNSDAEPSHADLVNYEAVVWFTGDEYGGAAGPGPQSEIELANWLNNATNACLFLSSQDYLYDRGLTPFMTSHLGVEDGGSDVGQSVVTGTLSYGGLGPYTLTFPVSLTNYSDVFTLTVGAEEAFKGDKGADTIPDVQTQTRERISGGRSVAGGSSHTSHTAAVYFHSGNFQTTWLGFPLEALPTPLDRLRTLHRFLGNCFPSDLQTIKTTADPVVTVGESFTYTMRVINHGPYRAKEVVVQDFIPNALIVNTVLHSSAVSCMQMPGSMLTCSIPDMFAGQEEVIQIVVNPFAPGDLTNFVFATNFAADPNPANNNTSVFVRVLNSGDTNLYLDYVTPNSSENSTSRNIQLFGANFQANTQVYLNGTLFPTRTFDTNNPDAIIILSLPGGYAPGSYTVRVENPGGGSASLYKGLMVFDPSTLRIDAITPNIGPNDRPVTLEIYGNGFAPDTQGRLIDVNSPTNVYALFPAGLLSSNHMRALVPYGIAPGAYHVEVSNPQQYTDTLNAAYQVIDGDSADDLFAKDFDLYVIPASPREGQNVTIGLTVRRRTGDHAPLEGAQIPVDAQVDISLGGTPITSFLSTGFISANHTIPITIVWPSPAAGDYLLTVQVHSPDLGTDSIPANDVVSRFIRVLPPSSDMIPPEILTITVKGGALVTLMPQYTVNTLATDDDSGVAYIYYIDYAFDRHLGDWMPVKRTGWLPFANGVDVDNILESTPGVHYVQAWVADHEGNISLPKSAFINLIPPKNNIIHDGGQIYRLPLTSGFNLQVNLTSLFGDADMFAWDSDGSLVDAAFGSYPFEQINVNSGEHPPGLYQVDVYGYATTSYWFEVNYLLTQHGPTSIDEVQGHIKGSDIPLQVVDDSPGGDVDVPPPPVGGGTIYLPVVIR